ncbi:hypothetical protein [Tsuneonella flava]|nr:hypothetical protein [Tsuneonella flava]
MMYRSGDQWLLRIAGYRWIPEGGAATRRREIAILDADAEELASRITEADLNQLSQLPFYGPNALFCLHGTTLAVSIGVAGKMSSATQHSCAGKTKLNQLAAAFRQLALKYDPEFEGLLSGLLE